MWIFAFNKRTLETTFLTEAPGFTYSFPNDPFGMEYNHFNDSRTLPLPLAVEQDLRNAP